LPTAVFRAPDSVDSVHALQKQVGYFNHRVLVADKLERQWLREVCFGIED